MCVEVFSLVSRHFFTTTNPLNLLCTPSQLDEAKNVVDKYR